MKLMAIPIVERPVFYPHPSGAVSSDSHVVIIELNSLLLFFPDHAIIKAVNL